MLVELFVIVSVLSTGLAKENNKLGMIVNGNDADINDYPYQVEFIYLNTLNCGGAIIGEKWVVSAAHCVYGFEDNVDDFSIRIGSSTVKTGGTIIGIKKIYTHPEFNYFASDYDLVLLELTDTIEFGPGAQPVGLPEESEETPVLPLGTMVNISGWGRLSEHGPFPDQLQATQIPILAQEVCSEVYQSYTNRCICAGYLNGSKDTCLGDSGGPLVFNNTLYGVVSYGNGCAMKKYPGVYSSIPRMRSFIKETANI